ncbi:MAG: hypothetical protein MI784_13665 [Cytophagales bacterium]|nr:hypothetical protein [Cytophagales bacterium]
MFDNSENNNQKGTFGDNGTQVFNDIDNYYTLNSEKSICHSILVEIISVLSNNIELENISTPLGDKTKEKIQYNNLKRHRRRILHLYVQQMGSIDRAYKTVAETDGKFKPKNRIHLLLHNHFLKLLGTYDQQNLNDDEIRKTKGDEILDKCIEYIVDKVTQNIKSKDLIDEDIEPCCQLVVYEAFASCKVLFMPPKLQPK